MTTVFGTSLIASLAMISMMISMMISGSSNVTSSPGDQ
jgi:hypothetical protein